VVRLQACQGLYFVHAWGLDAVRSDLSLRAQDRPAVCYIPVARQDAVSSSSSPGCRLAIGAPADGVACPREGEGNSGPAWQATRSVASRPAPLARVPGRSARTTHVHRSGRAAALLPPKGRIHEL